MLQSLSFKKIYLILFICFFILFSGCQKNEPESVTTNSTSTTTNNTANTRQVKDNEIKSSSRPEGTFRITNELPFLADTSFTIEQKSDAQVFFFSDYNEDEIFRFVQIQFESYKPESEETYKYELKDSVKIGDVVFGKSYWCFNLEQAAAERPVSDIAAVQTLLRSREVNTRGMFSGVRLLWLSEDKRSEMLVIYGEKTSFRNIDCSNRKTAEPLLEELNKQFLKDFSVIKFKN
ncbi:MAG TPA: hypothetical protein PKA90_15425 [Ignavibacteria bacterium]|nr:hypothetical protein [Ignavibacteria bacterium]HMR41809.1 hypothetical protein [Ignavibacteria bacterium]